MPPAEAGTLVRLAHGYARRRFGEVPEPPRPPTATTSGLALENRRSRRNAALGVTDQGFSSEACRVPWADDADAVGQPTDVWQPGLRK